MSHGSSQYLSELRVEVCIIASPVEAEVLLELEVSDMPAPPLVGCALFLEPATLATLVSPSLRQFSLPRLTRLVPDSRDLTPSLPGRMSTNFGFIPVAMHI